MRLVALGLALAATALLPASALAVNPESEVAGSNSKWYSGSLLQQAGNNCSILGESYTETMVSAIAGYGGAPGGDMVKVGDRYYASLLVSIPGNPCGSGSSVVATDVFLPRGTTVDTSAQIRCFGQPRNASTFIELTGGSWSHMGYSGKYCPDQVGQSQTGFPGSIGVGYRPLASGQLFEVFVPIKSSDSLQGAGHSPADELHWALSSTGTYSNPGVTSVWVNVLAAGAGTPAIYFARNPSVVPYWDATAPAGEESKAEWFANLYSAGHAGTFCWELHDGPVANDPAYINCSAVGTWNGTITAGPDTWQVTGGGPNGGYVPFAYTNPNFQQTIRWKFTYNPGGGNQTVTNDITFRTLAGPDPDGDGVPNDGTDACPDVKGTQADGCQPPVQTDPDGDGVFGSVDRCPDQAGSGSPDGCPAGGASPGPGGSGSTPGEPGAPAPAAPLTGAVSAIKGGKLKRSALAKGVRLPVTCSGDSSATAKLTVSRKVARKLKIKLKRGQTSATVATARATCAAATGGTLKLKLARAYAKKVRRARGAVAATVTVVFTRPGSADVVVRRAVKLT